MIRGLLYFSVLLILLGAYGGAYPVSIVGVLLLIPALAAPSRRPSAEKKPPPPPLQQYRRVIPRTAPVPMDSQAAVSATPHAEPPALAPFEHQETYTGALFPTSIFPTLSLSPVSQQAAEDPRKAVQGQKDEVLEVGTIVAIMKLILG